MITPYPSPLQTPKRRNNTTNNKSNYKKLKVSPHSPTPSSSTLNINKNNNAIFTTINNKYLPNLPLNYNQYKLPSYHPNYQLSPIAYGNFF